MKDLVFISSVGINDFVDTFPKIKDEYFFPNIGSEFFGSLMSEYFSFGGFYKIKGMGKESIKLKKLGKSYSVRKRTEKYNSLDFLQSVDHKIQCFSELTGKGKFDLEKEGFVHLVCPKNTFDLRDLVRKGVSIVEGEIYKRKFKGKIKHNFFDNYSIYVDKDLN